MSSFVLSQRRGVLRCQTSSGDHMKPATEFEEINGRFEAIDELLVVCQANAEETHDMEYATLVVAVQRLSKEVRSLERNLLAIERGLFK